ncbi:MAG: type II toxin-antitoxin system RelE/ParE family toxin [Candidatus Aenigmarchaeota archaeon]|nr:type II toxin-antitoxin system RelE/ParE family toxin [Candidatus Aenigmarchaeota archaeon]
MFKLIFKEQFDRSFSKIRDNSDRAQIWKKIQQLKEYPVGKKLVGNPYWSVHVGKYRVLYVLHSHASEIEIIDIIRRKHSYREVG